MSLLENKRVLVVEDTTIAATYLARELTNLGAIVVGLARSEDQAVEMVSQFKPELILMDIHLSDGGNGINAARRIGEIHNLPLVYTTSFSDDATLSQALETSPYGYVVKPFDTKTIKVSCETALKRFELEYSLRDSEEKLRVAAEAAQFGIMELNESGTHFTFTGAASLRNRLGASTEVDLDHFLSLFDEQDRTDVMGLMDSRNSMRKTIHINDGEETIWLDVLFSELNLNDGKVTIGAVIDVTEKQRQQKRLQISNVILEQLAEGVAIVDNQYRIVEANKSLYRLLGLEHTTAIGKQIFDFGLTPKIFSECENLGPHHVLRHKISMRTDSNQMFPAFITLSLLDSPLEDQKYVVTLSDISDLSRAEKKLEEMAFSDPLTGTGNRNYLKLLLNESTFTSSIRSLVFLDLDGFKAINDSYGHDIGDELLALCARRIKAVIRESDTLIRHGGDEFVLLVQDATDVKALAQRILETVSTPMQIDNLNITVSASIGIADASVDGTADDLLRQADIAMYEAKKRGKNTFVAYSEDQSQSIEYRLFVEQGLYQALLNKDLYATFQPIVDAQNRIVALEALCRWKGRNFDGIQPDTFIPVAEETGLINALGLKMLREVCIACSLLSENGLGHTKVHINVSLLQLTSASLVEQFVTYLADFNVSPRSIVIEVKESSLIDPAARRVVRALAGKGFHIAIDDFGKGQLAVSDLKEASTSIIKFDRCLLEDLADVPTKVLTESLVELCKKLGKQVLFEGIETQEQADFAAKVGSDMLQGYRYGMPSAITEIVKQLSLTDVRSAY